LWQIAKVQARAGDAAGAAVTSEQAVRAAASIAEPSRKARILGRIAEVQAEAGDAAGAARTLEQALRAGATITDPSEKSEVLYVIADVKAKAGDVPLLNTAGSSCKQGSLSGLAQASPAPSLCSRPQKHPASGSISKRS
jgi:hypothetical protein